MTKFINCVPKEKGKKETEFLYYLEEASGWLKTNEKPKSYEEVYYLGCCRIDGDMFSAKEGGCITIFKGTKGDEFN